MSTFADIKSQLAGHSKEILIHCGIPAAFLTGKKTACPACRAGKDRFCYDQKLGKGSSFCNQCGSNKDIFGLISKVKTCTNAQAIRLVANYLNNNQARSTQPTIKETLGAGQDPTLDREKHARAADQARTLIKQCVKREHPYLIKKGINSQVLINSKRFNVAGSTQVIQAGSLVVPLFSLVNDELICVQFINKDGSKGYLSGGSISNAVHLIKPVDSEDSLDFVSLCEGYADCLTVSILLNCPVFMCCNAAGIASKSRAIKALCPTKQILIMADNDPAGMAAAREAQKQTGALIISAPEDGGGTDWNDYFQIHGLDNIEKTRSEINFKILTQTITTTGL